MTSQAILAWATTVTGATIMYCAGRQRTRRFAWYLGVANQFLWGAYAIMGAPETLGFLVGSLLYGTVYVRNIIRGD